mmetsp:Transcript_12978/g.41476  ORF Transcript_12978/g.41476 Transcript_12978/m.41476 type:complete len:210 (+) Transcript_12978:404-1033(+)
MPPQPLCLACTRGPCLHRPPSSRQGRSPWATPSSAPPSSPHFPPQRPPQPCLPHLAAAPAVPALHATRSCNSSLRRSPYALAAPGRRRMPSCAVAWPSARRHRQSPPFTTRCRPSAQSWPLPLATSPRSSRRPILEPRSSFPPFFLHSLRHLIGPPVLCRTARVPLIRALDSPTSCSAASSFCARASASASHAETTASAFLRFHLFVSS